MSEVISLEPPDAPELHESIAEHLELSHYISIFSTSAGRVRYVIFILVVFSIIVFVAQWNTTNSSWMMKRYEKLNCLYDTTTGEKETAFNERIYKETGKSFRTRRELGDFLREYDKEIARVFVPEIPGLGTRFDVNDLGLFSGIAFVFLLVLLWFSLSREYENLRIALRKVYALHDEAGAHVSPDSGANFLYHALAMTEVFSSPPTLAQPFPSSMKRIGLSLVFVIPFAVQAYVVWVNYQTEGVPEAYGASAAMALQFVLLLAVAVLCATAIAYEVKSNERWVDTFGYINRSFEYRTAR
jgi:hypothetical protein